LFQRIADIAAEQGATLTVDAVKGFLKLMDDESEMDPIDLMGIAGGRSHSAGMKGRC